MTAVASMQEIDTAVASLKAMTVVDLRADPMAYIRTIAMINGRIKSLIPVDHSPAAIWRRAYQRSISDGKAERSRRWKARAINLDPEPLHNAIALSGMAPLQVDEEWMLAVAIPQPAPTNDMGYNIEDVILVNPKTGKAKWMGDMGATHVAPPAGMVRRLPVMPDAKEWARHIALDRLEFWHTRAERRRMIQADPIWNGWPTAALLLVEPKKMRWSQLDAAVLEVPADMREIVRRAVLADARLPKIEGRA